MAIKYKQDTNPVPPMEWIRVYHNMQDDSYPIHWHTSMEVIMPYVNNYTVVINGQKNIVEVGDIFLIPPGELHTLYAPDEGERLIMLFDFSIFSSLSDMNALLDSIHPFKHFRSSEAPTVCATLSRILKEIEYEYFHDNVYRDASLYYMLCNFLVTMGRADMKIKTPFPNIPEAKQHEYVNKFMSVCNYINDNYTNDLPIERLCEMTGLTKNFFSKMFEQFTGLSFIDYLNQKRISYAEKLLIYPGISTTEVAMQCGFKSLSTFNRAFRLVKKCSPTEYRSFSAPNLNTDD